MHEKLSQILKTQEENYYKVIVEYLRKKENELKSVTNELSLKASRDDFKEKIIARLQTAVGKLELEGNEVLTHVIKQKKEVKGLKDQMREVNEDKVLLFSKARESTRIVRG